MIQAQLKRNNLTNNKQCVECKEKIASHWSNYLCEDCFRKFLRGE